MLRVTASAQHFHVDPYARELDTEVVASRPTQGGCELELRSTLFYPTGGGQPFDVGFIGELRVQDVNRADGRIWHRVDGSLEAGTRVRTRLDWGRRFDHMQQHSAQHLLSAIAEDIYGCKTLSFHLGDETCTVDLSADKLSDAQRLELEGVVNAQILQALPMRARSVDKEQFERLDIRTRGLPEGVSGPIRLIEIKGVDLNTCGGTHVRNTAELQSIKLLSTERIRGQVRLHFIVGGRVLCHLERALTEQRALTELLKAGPKDHASLVQNALLESKQGAKERHQILVALAAALAPSLIAQGSGLIAYHHAIGAPSLPFLQELARALNERAPTRPALLTSGHEYEAQAGGVFLLTGSPDFTTAAKPLVLQTLQAKGGGRPGQLQGKADNLSEVARCEVADALAEQNGIE